MKKIILSLITIILLTSCITSKEAPEIDANIDYATQYAKTITEKDLAKHLFIYASDEFEGRNTGEAGQKKAANYLKDFYTTQGINSPLGKGKYFQEVPAEFLNKNQNRELLKDSENVVAFIKGSEKPNEVLVISAHLDHIGTSEGKINNGADDDGSGTVAILEIAEAFQKAVREGKGPKRSILFLHVTGEEKGLLGSKYYVENPVFPIANTVANLNIDMIGRIDERHKENPNFIYLIGSDKLSKDLHNLSENVNSKYTNISLDYKYNDPKDPNRFYYRSDHYNFAKYNVPIIFYFNGIHKDYHKHTDTPDKINYDLLQNRSRLIFYTAWEIVNRETRLIVDK